MSEQVVKASCTAIQARIRALHIAGRMLADTLTVSLYLTLACGRSCPDSKVKGANGSLETNSATARQGSPQLLVRQRNVRVEFGIHALEMDPADGGRIVEFSLNGRNVIIPKDESPEGFGSSFWPSPQKDWSGPPPAEFDKLPWNVTLDGNSVTLESRIVQKTDLSARQRITPIPSLSAIGIVYQITNHSNEPRQVAPWQTTRVRPKGMTFFPSHEPSFPESTLALAPSEGIIWYTHKPADIDRSVTSLVDGQEGWMAQVDGHLLFVKAFPDVARVDLAPESGEVIIHAHASARFLEIEQQGEYTELPPGQTLTWPVFFVLQVIPETTEIRVGNPQLVSMARRMACSVRP